MTNPSVDLHEEHRLPSHTEALTIERQFHCSQALLCQLNFSANPLGILWHALSVVEGSEVLQGFYRRSKYASPFFTAISASSGEMIVIRDETIHLISDMRQSASRILPTTEYLSGFYLFIEVAEKTRPPLIAGEVIRFLAREQVACIRWQAQAILAVTIQVFFLPPRAANPGLSLSVS
jgi:hypothetical protein